MEAPECEVATDSSIHGHDACTTAHACLMRGGTIAPWRATALAGVVWCATCRPRAMPSHLQREYTASHTHIKFVHSIFSVYQCRCALRHEP